MPAMSQWRWSMLFTNVRRPCLLRSLFFKTTRSRGCLGSRDSADFSLVLLRISLPVSCDFFLRRKNTNGIIHNKPVDYAKFDFIPYIASISSQIAFEKTSGMVRIFISISTSIGIFSTNFSSWITARGRRFCFCHRAWGYIYRLDFQIFIHLYVWPFRAQRWPTYTRPNISATAATAAYLFDLWSWLSSFPRTVSWFQ